MEHDKRPEQQTAVSQSESIRTALEESAHLFQHIHEESKRMDEARAEAEEDFLKKLAAYKAEQNEKYVGETGKKVRVTGWAEIIVRSQEGDWEYQQTDLNEKEVITQRVDVRNFDPNLRTAETSMSLPLILRATDNDDRSFNIPLRDDTLVEFISEE